VAGRWESSNELGQIGISTSYDDHWVEIRVEDNGTGIPPEIIDQIFTPFFTTKDVGKGTGQGLALAHNVIVDRHGGQLLVESTLGEGTTFVVKLPRTPEAA
jgi:signal transduction histidine kinase